MSFKQTGLEVTLEGVELHGMEAWFARVLGLGEHWSTERTWMKIDWQSLNRW